MLSIAASGALVGIGLLPHWLHVGQATVGIGLFVTAIMVGGWMLLPGSSAAVRQLWPNISYSW